MLVHSGSSKDIIDPKLIRGVECRMLDYTEINPPMEIKAAGHYTLFGIAQDILLVLVRDTQDVWTTVKLPIVFVPGLGSFFCSSFGSPKRCQNYFHYGRVHR